jgi:hypothetical protein
MTITKATSATSATKATIKLICQCKQCNNQPLLQQRKHRSNVVGCCRRFVRKGAFVLMLLSIHFDTSITTARVWYGCLVLNFYDEKQITYVPTKGAAVNSTLRIFCTFSKSCKCFVQVYVPFLSYQICRIFT